MNGNCCELNTRPAPRAQVLRQASAELAKSLGAAATRMYRLKSLRAELLRKAMGPEHCE